MTETLLPMVILASYELPEAELIKDLVYAFQGIEGKWIRFDTSKDGYRIDSQVPYIRNFSFGFNFRWVPDFPESPKIDPAKNKPYYTSSLREIAKIILNQNFTHHPSVVFLKISRRKKFPVYGMLFAADCGFSCQCQVYVCKIFKYIMWMYM